jgi:hypothetical protein
MPTDDLPVRLTGPGKGGQGRSSFKVGAKGLKIIEDLTGRGCSLTTIAKVLRMSRDTLREVRMRQPEVEEAYQRGLANEHDALTSNLRRLADEGNVVANLFLLKARHGYREGEPLEVNVAVNTGGVLVVPADISVEDYIRQKQEAGEIEPMRDVTPRPRSLMPEPIEHLPEAPIPSSRPEEPAPRRTPTGTRITRGD